MKHSTPLLSLALVFCLATPFCSAGTNPSDDQRGARKQPAPAAAKQLTYHQLVEKAYKGALSLTSQFAAAERAYLQKLSQNASFRSMAADIIDLGEKFAQAGELFQSQDRSDARMRHSFRRRVFDDAKLLDRWNKAFLEMQRVMLSDTYQLFLLSGRKAESFPETYPYYTFKPSLCPDPFAPLFGHAARIAKSDWMREIAVYAGAELTGSTAQSLAEGLGLFEADSILSSLFGAAVDVVATQVIEEIQDPAGDIANVLQRRFDALCDSIISGQRGFTAACEFIINKQLKFRAELLGLRPPVRGKAGDAK